MQEHEELPPDIVNSIPLHLEKVLEWGPERDPEEGATSKVSPEPETASDRASTYRDWMKTLPNKFFATPVR